MLHQQQLPEESTELQRSLPYDAAKHLATEGYRMLHQHCFNLVHVHSKLCMYNWIFMVPAAT
jgi:hypothetical protein